MTISTSSPVSRLAWLPLLGALVVSLAWTAESAPQDTSPGPRAHKHTSKSVDADKDLAAQVRELQAKIGKLEAALKKSHAGTPSRASDIGGMGGMPTGMMGSENPSQGLMGLGGMEGMKSDEMMGQMMQEMGQMMQMMGQMQKKGLGGGKQGMAGMMGMEDMMMGGMSGPKPGMAGMGGQGMGGVGTMEDDGMGMMGMGSTGPAGTKGMRGMQMSSALPGFPGASHIYHIGATGFFLDHPDHIRLTNQQQTILNGHKEKALLEKSTSQRQIGEAEQELWTLTASDKPDVAKIEAKVGEIEKLRGDQRLAFIHAVGEAAKVMTDEQRKTLLGEVTPGKAEKAPAHSGH
jgi:Spy/CpxP family protein refolding chaperone